MQPNFTLCRHSTLDQKKIKQLRTIGHKLKPIVTLADNGLNDNIAAELERALVDHELIKIKLSHDDKQQRQLMLNAVIETTQAQVVQAIGKTALLYRLAKKPNKKLSNLHRFI